MLSTMRPFIIEVPLGMELVTQRLRCLVPKKNFGRLEGNSHVHCLMDVRVRKVGFAACRIPNYQRLCNVYAAARISCQVGDNRP